VAGGQSLAFPIDIDRRPYNTLALPCECVIIRYKLQRNINELQSDFYTYITVQQMVVINAVEHRNDYDIITHSGGSRRGRVFSAVCLCVFHTISQNPMHLGLA